MEDTMKSLTIHGIDNILDMEIKKKSRTLKMSLNKTIKSILAEHLHLNTGKPATDNRREFAEFCGVWSGQDVKDFRASLKWSEKVDPEDWS
jgi:hypothetical protein